GLDRIQGKKIAILGLSFKENTDDIRESVSIKLIKLLLKQKCKISVHDPKAIENTRNVFGDKLSYHKTTQDVLKDSDCAVVMTPWEEYKKLGRKDFQIMRHPLVIDTRRIVRVDDEKINYIGLGVGT
ncbi:MAG: UDP-glucose 6-dehydrogenase, partial [Nitrosopumilaceae archaeon]|nr:UDP-glucose 6-dehydrogenase [Nitrosopumilaceae archaeon]